MILRAIVIDLNAPNCFCADQSRDVYSKYFCNPKNWNHHQNQVCELQLAQLTGNLWHTPNHLLSPYPHYLDKCSNYWSLLLDESQVDY